MLEDLFSLSQNFLTIYNRQYVRYFIKTHPLPNRFSIIGGQRGVGKTTAIIQFILRSYPGDLFTPKALYIQADHFLVAGQRLYEIAEEFYNLGGELICFDEIHKYAEWAGELKSIHDTFPKLKIIASGSSALEVYRGSHDLSRRAVVYRMFGMSLREYIELTTGLELTAFTLEEVVKNHPALALEITKALEPKKKKILALFREYLDFGYYPYFFEYKDKRLFYLTLEQNIRTTLEGDLLTIYPSLSGNTIKKIKKLLAVVAAAVPFTPDLKKIKTLLDIGDERTLKTYLKYLEDAGVILTVSAKDRGLRSLAKPEKIYLNNPNLIQALVGSSSMNKGNIRETFFLNMVQNLYDVTFPAKGDFQVSNRYIFEVGGPKKTYDQIRDLPDSYLAVDDLERGIGNRIPLWLFGFLY
ncbi:MAG: AAA family ATPase [Deltaproteobacteria bacterium]|nr:AAA family ATPase [Deltaproteobacteria bacterium]